MDGKHTPPEFRSGKLVKIFPRESRDDKGRYHLSLRWSDNGKQRREALGLWVLSRERLKWVSNVERMQSQENARQAEILRARREEALFEGVTGIIPSRRKRGRAFLPYFDKVMAGKGVKTQEQYRNTRAYIVEFAGVDVMFSDITRDWIKDFGIFLSERISQKTRKPLSTNTQATAFKLFKAVLHDAMAGGVISTDPSYKIATPRGGDKLERLDNEELERLESYYRGEPSDEVLRAFLFSCYAGLRVSDVESLTWGSVLRSGANVSIYYKQQKTQQRQAIPLLSNDAIRLLGEQPKGAGRDAKVFGLRSRVDTGERIKRLGLSVLGRYITFHISRHTFAMRALERGVDVTSVKEMLGHSDIQTTMKYVRASKRSLLNDIDKLNR